MVDFDEEPIHGVHAQVINEVNIKQKAVIWASNRVRAGFSPALPTPPRMRVRTGRFIAGFINRLDSET